VHNLRHVALVDWTLKLPAKSRLCSRRYQTRQHLYSSARKRSSL